VNDLVLKFGKEFTKLPYAFIFETKVIHYATLLQVIPSKFELLSQVLKEYDGCFVENNMIKFWPFPDSGDCLICFFESEWLNDEKKSVLFTTIRKGNAENKALYLPNVGKSFRILMERI